jgi:hypothetical protein
LSQPDERGIVRAPESHIQLTLELPYTIDDSRGELLPKKMSCASYTERDRLCTNSGRNNVSSAGTKGDVEPASDRLPNEG